MPGRYVRKGVIRRALNPLDRGRIPLPGWLRDCLTLWALAAALYALVWPLSNTPVAPLLAAGAVVLALVGLWISAVNVFELYKSAREQLAVRKDYTVVSLSGDLRFVDEVVAEGRRSIGAAHPDAKTVTRRVGENQAALNVYARQRSDGKMSLCGYALLYPLRDDLGEAVLTGAIRSEAELGSNPLRGSFLGARYLYVAMIWGADQHGRWQVKDGLRGPMLEVLDGGSIEWVFARPGSAFGEAMMREYGFAPIDDRSGVWSIEGKRLRRRLLAERALNTAIVGSPELAATGRGAGPV